MQIIIVAGGGGTRLWPLSTDKNPKQFVGLIDEESLLQKTYNRLRENFPANSLWVATGQNTSHLVAEQLGQDFDPTHLIVEPSRRDTFAAEIAACALVSHYTSKEESIIFIPCDDWITNPEDVAKFNRAIKIIDETLQSNTYDFVTAGVVPAYPNAQVEMLEIEPESMSLCYDKVVPVKSFVMRSTLAAAAQFSQTGRHFWHKHNPSFTYNSLIKTLQEFHPEVVALVESIYTSGTLDAEIYNELPIDSIDSALLKNTDSIGMISMDITWEDIGNWEVVYTNLPDLEKTKEAVKALQIDGSGNKLRVTDTHKKVAFVGVSNLLVVETNQGLLIIDPKYAAQVKEVSKLMSE